jgi:hypothetical protein
MNNLAPVCNDERRRKLVRGQAGMDGGLNGIDFVEVVDGSDQLQLCVHFFGGLPETLVPANIRIEGGERIREVGVLSIEPHRSPDPEHEDCLRVTIDKAGDFSCYRLCLYELEEGGRTSDKLLKGFDPFYACSPFSFNTECASELDCKHHDTCPPVAGVVPVINYLAKDYASFHQLLLDRLALLIPEWRERHVPDIGIALVEVLAYVGDHLSYYQDAVATEAYLETARERISVRRHARLVDYLMHEGCNSRAWVCVKTESDIELESGEFYFITRCTELVEAAARSVISEEALGDLNIPTGRYEVFEPLPRNGAKRLQFYEEHNEISFYTWGNSECCLPSGSTSASLLDKLVQKRRPAETQQQQQQAYIWKLAMF